MLVSLLNSFIKKKSDLLFHCLIPYFLIFALIDFCTVGYFLIQFFSGVTTSLASMERKSQYQCHDVSSVETQCIYLWEAVKFQKSE